MPYPIFRLGKTTFLYAIALLTAIPGIASPMSKNYFHSPFSQSHNLTNYALYNRDSAQSPTLKDSGQASTLKDSTQALAASGFVHRAANGDLVITVPMTASSRYKIRFFDQRNVLLFEIRQIRDALLIVEKFNFEHAGQFHYELYRDLTLVERSGFSIQRE